MGGQLLYGMSDDGVDYVRFSCISTKGTGLADYNTWDGTIEIHLDNLWEEVSDSEYANPEGVLRERLIDVLGHEIYHKWFVWGLSEDFTETFNEQDERIMRVCSQWIYFDKKATILDWG